MPPVVWCQAKLIAYLLILQNVRILVCFGTLHSSYFFKSTDCFKKGVIRVYNILLLLISEHCEHSLTTNVCYL